MTHLELGFSSIKNKFPELPTTLEFLNLSNQWVSWNGQIWKFEESKNCGKSNVFEELPQSIANLKNLKTFICCSNVYGIRNLDIISNLHNLEELYVGDSRILDIGFIKELRNLRILGLNGNYIEDISPLQDLKNLEVLNLYNNRIRSIEAISELPNIKYLNISHNLIEKVQPLTKLKTLQKLSIDGNDLKDELTLEDLGDTIISTGIYRIKAKNINLHE